MFNTFLRALGVLDPPSAHAADRPCFQGMPRSEGLNSPNIEHVSESVRIEDHASATVITPDGGKR